MPEPTTDPEHVEQPGSMEEADAVNGEPSTAPVGNGKHRTGEEQADENRENESPA